MGCCRPEKKVEENDIYSFFQKMEKEQHLVFTIDNYESNYERIIELSSNKFKKLKKKQQVRLGFVNEILNNINKIYIDEKEGKVTRYISFYLLILALTLENYIKEKKNFSENNNNNDLQQFLLAIVIKILKKQFFNPNNLKVVMYYVAKLLDLLFPQMENLSQYYNIEDYINIINGITDEKEILHSIEIYPFIRVNLSCLGQCFASNPNIHLNKNSINILINYYVHAYLFNRTFLFENYKSFSKLLFLYNNANNSENNKNFATSNNNIISNSNYNTNYNTNYKSNYNTNNINTNTNYKSNDNGNSNLNVKNNKIIQNSKSSNNILKSYTTDLVYKKTTFRTTKKNNNNNNNNFLNLSNHSLTQSKIKDNNIFKNSFVSNIDDLASSNNKISYLDLFKSQEFKDIKNITLSFYYFLNITIQDTLVGKSLFSNFDEIIDSTIDKMAENDIELSCKIDINLNKSIFKIIYLILFNKCKLENNTIIILSFLNFISDKIKEEKLKEHYHDILSQIYFLFNNDNIKHLIISIFSKSFIKDIGNKSSIDVIVQMFKSDQSMFHSNKIRIFKHFLINIGTNFKETKEINLQIKILNKLSDILRQYTLHFNKEYNDDSYLDLFSTESKIKYKLKKEEILSLFQNFELDEEIFHENNYNYHSYFIKYIKFHVNLSIFLTLNFIFNDIFKEFPERKKAFEKLIYFITELEIFSLSEKENCIKDIIILIQIILKIVKKNSIDCLDDFHSLCCNMGDSLQKIIKEINYNYSSPTRGFILKLSYSVIIFILIQLKKIFHFPNSIIKIHQTIIESIAKCDNKIALYIDEIKCEFYNECKLSSEIYQDFKDYLKENEINNMEIKYDLFDKIINIMYDKLFGNLSSLHLFFEGQNFNSGIQEEGVERNITKMSQDHFDYISHIQMKFTEDKEEVSIRKKNDNDFINIPEFNDIDTVNDKESLSFDNEYSEHLKV